MMDVRLLSHCKLCRNKTSEKAFFEIKDTPSIIQNLASNPNQASKEKINIKVYKCNFCGLVQLNNRPVTYYKTVIRSAGISTEMQKFRRSQIKKFKQKYSLINNLKVIEIGCGAGEYLKILSEFFEDATGLEYGVDNLKTCNYEKLNVIKGYIDKENYKISNKKYESFFCFNFLEHIPDPRSFLLGLRFNLSPGAIGIIEVPNYEYMLSKKISYDYSPEHLTYFTKKTLRLLLTLAGFECRKINTIWHNHIISAEVKISPREADYDVMEKSLKSIVSKVEELINKYESLVVWGACHHSFFLLSQAKNYKKIKYIVDSAKFKIGRYSPKSAIKICSPKELDLKTPEALLILASSYSSEVAKIALHDYPKISKIYVLSDNKIVNLR